jgi:hypothetical protein
MKSNVVGKYRETHANADTRISSLNFAFRTVSSVVERIRRRHAERQPIFTSLDSNAGPRNYDFPLFPLYFLSFVTFKRSFILI